MLGQLIKKAMDRVEDTIFNLKKKKKKTVPFGVRVEALTAIPQSLELLAAAEKLEKNESFRQSGTSLKSTKTVKAALTLYLTYLSLAAGVLP